MVIVPQEELEFNIYIYTGKIIKTDRIILLQSTWSHKQIQRWGGFDFVSILFPVVLVVFLCCTLPGGINVEEHRHINMIWNDSMSLSLVYNQKVASF